MDQKKQIIERYFKTIDSTQIYLKENWKDLFQVNKWISVRASEQTAGRGQRNNKWFSPLGDNLYVTFFFQIQSKFYTKLCYIPQTAIISLYQAVTEILQNQLDFKIKWVNDLYLNDKKIAGVLSESEIEEDELNIFIGIGVNVNMDFSNTDLQDKATSLYNELKIQIDVEKLYNLLRDKLMNNITTLFKEEKYFQKQIYPLLKQKLYKIGKQVILWDINQLHIQTSGTLDGLTSEGHLQIRLENGILTTYNSGKLEFI